MHNEDSVIKLECCFVRLMWVKCILMNSGLQVPADYYTFIDALSFKIGNSKVFKCEVETLKS